MSGKSKKKKPQKSPNEIRAEVLAMFLWVWIDDYHPSKEAVYKMVQGVKAEIGCLNDGVITMSQIRNRLFLDYGIDTSWGDKE